MQKTCLITGASRGIGYETAKGLGHKGHKVYITGRNSQKGQEAAQKLSQEGIQARFIELDITDPQSIVRARTQLAQHEEKLDVLINNAGIMIDSIFTPDKVSFEDFSSTLSTNTTGPYFLIQEFMPLLAKSPDARVINMSSDLGALSQASDPQSRFDAVLAPGYRISKAALNMVTLIYAKHFRDTDISICSCSPGWCQTSLDPHIDSSKAPNTALDGAQTPIWLAAEANKADINGQFFYKKSTINW
ncbi:SDR family oxidoreductase [Alcaligenes sp. SMD-FA]|uniref:SDR family oxidoreductase n=1 Tax=Alcaligenes sp. SMD-FA TaxID=2991054 RepID=UPI002225F649|nr:SDR family oxidoreductase [Alcaligenes sp. SMD-FA]UYY88567.1 SDR family oxidoreductase [Alcaligenes sp. SMD-FA]